ncbi:cbb3-type cytochrome c oxidase subunit [Candidatus Photodesmus katoptron]|uniref:Cbb3-type cytochrome c oxidase subunit n=1 Tax=Candidatus Photodesmus katoptron Akat1 TaxID=1236703 RepID=S3DGK9_9GAMM|nr:cytochrome-c oxidase, cbb3-type subunit III [Candidatus Photodesmus katoptron]EPE37592.1 cytochrome c oxidase, cbb3-type, subunit III [Candidatus Photodesmus katoptron Akat1]KEY90691.1 cbb3-type cytochrome c oxidase subunit [Candidatus Photodesmus katoptron]
MTIFWSFWIFSITISTLLACTTLLFWCLKNKVGIEDGKDMGHEYDGIRELNNPLPRWWVYLFISALIFSIIYLILYPGLGNFQGILKWKSSNQTVQTLKQSKASILESQKNKSLIQYAKELDEANIKFNKIFKQLAYQEEDISILRSLPDIAKNPNALKVGQRLFLQNCSQCHGSDARGQKGFPDLTNNIWIYGGEPADIVKTVMQGRIGEMPGWKNILDDKSIKSLVSYTLSLSGRSVNTREAKLGEKHFIVCSACHGTDGKGNSKLGAPDLTDQIWVYGGSRADVTESIKNGRFSVMPSWKDILDEDKIQLVSAYVWSLNNKDND